MLIGHILFHFLKYLLFTPLYLFRIVPIKIDILWANRTNSCLFPWCIRCLFGVHSREHARICATLVILSV